MNECTKRNCRWTIGIVLFISLALNLFLAGWLFGADKFDRPHGRGMFFERFNDRVETLPSPEREEAKAVLDRYQPQMRKQMRAIMRSREAIDRMFKRKDYSRAEAEERFAVMQEQSLAMQELMQGMMLDLADVLPPTHRAKFLDRPKEWRGKGAEFKSKKPTASR